MSRAFVLTMHAEALHEDVVWRDVSDWLSGLERVGVVGTIFVHPFLALRAGADLTERLGELIQRGHEIGQHTHFYAEYREGDSKVRKTTALDETTVAASLQRDFDYLTAAGCRPRGFVAGGWAVSHHTFSWLASHGFWYDCTYRTYALRYASAEAQEGDRAAGVIWHGPILEVPTTGSFTDMWRDRRWRRPAVRDYELAYLHDTDLQPKVKGMLLGRVAKRIVRAGYEPIHGVTLAKRQAGDRSVRTSSEHQSSLARPPWA